MPTPYVYRIEHVETGKFYYGSRSRNVKSGLKPEDDLFKSYFSSSRTVSKLIAEHGLDSFKAEVVFTSDQYHECYWYEQQLIKDSISSPLCLNRHYVDPINGNGMFSVAGSTWTQRIQGRQKGENNPFYGKKHSAERNAALGNKISGAAHPQAKTWRITSPEGDEFIITGTFIAFCKEHDLRVDTMMDMALHGLKPKRGKHVGWTCERL